MSPRTQETAGKLSANQRGAGGINRRFTSMRWQRAQSALLRHPCALRARLRGRGDADGLAGGVRAVPVHALISVVALVAAGNVAAGIGIARSLVLAIGVWIEERAIARLGDHLLRHRREADHGQDRHGYQ